MPGEDTPLLMAANAMRKRASNSTVLKAMIDIMGRAAVLAQLRSSRSWLSAWVRRRRIGYDTRTSVI